MKKAYLMILNLLIRTLSKYRNGILVSHMFDIPGPFYKTKTKSGKPLAFYTPGITPFTRVATLYSKEPETIEWIDTINEDEILFDIGANVGMYTIYAAVEKKAKVYSFEPAFMNYSILNHNISINNLQHQVSAYCIGLSNKVERTELYMSEIENGMALLNMGESVDFNGNPVSSVFTQGILSYSIDQLIADFHFPSPNHIKIDVDGLEPQIIEGATETLKSPHLKSILIEINEERSADKDIVKKIEESGFKLLHKKHAEQFDNSIYSSIYNYIFLKEKCAPQNKF